MSVQLMLSDVLAPLRTSLKSFEVRALTAEVQNARHNIVTVIEFSSWPVEVLQRNQEKKLPSGPGTEGPLSFSQAFFEFDNWDRIADACSAGRMRVAKDVVEFACFADPRQAIGLVPSPNHFVENVTPWPMFHGALRARTSEQTSALMRDLNVIRHSREAQAQMSRLGFESVNEFLHQRFGAARDSEPEIGAIYVVVHVRAVIHDVEVQPTTHRVIAHALVAPELQQDVWIRGLMRKQVPDVMYELVFGSFGRDCSRQQLAEVRAEAEWDFLLPFEIELRLVHRSLGIIGVYRRSTISALPEAYRNPLLSVLEQFCPSEDLSQMLVAPTDERRSDLKTQRVFERNVQWLLSTHGFIAVNLGDHEHLHDRTTGVRIGSLDILGFHPVDRILLLGSCTLKAPDDGDYANLERLRTIVSRTLGDACGVTVVGAIFTTAEGVTSSAVHRIAVFGGTRLPELVSDAASGEPRLLKEELQLV